MPAWRRSRTSRRPEFVEGRRCRREGEPPGEPALRQKRLRLGRSLALPRGPSCCRARSSFFAGRCFRFLLTAAMRRLGRFLDEYTARAPRTSGAPCAVTTSLHEHTPPWHRRQGRPSTHSGRPEVLEGRSRPGKGGTGGGPLSSCPPARRSAVTVMQPAAADRAPPRRP